MKRAGLWFSWLLIAGVPLESLAATWTVGGTSGDFDTISEAVDAAEPGDTLSLYPGVYEESIFLDKDLTVMGTDSATTILTSEALVLETSEAEVTLSGFTIQGTGEQGLSVNGGSVTITDLEVSGANTTLLNGAGVQVNDSVVSIDGSRFLSNRAVGQSGGHIGVFRSTVDITNSEFKGGRAQRGGGVFALSSILNISSTVFEDNAARRETEAGRGGAIRLELTTATISDSTFMGNSVEDGFGGQISTFGGSLVLENSVVIDGACTESFGGGLAVVGGDVSISGSSFIDNQSTLSATSELGHAGGVFLSSDAGNTFEIKDTEFEGNYSDNYGGAIHLSSGDLVLQNITVRNNQAFYGGGLYLSGDGSIMLGGSLLDGNVGNHGGGIRWRPPAGTGRLEIFDTEVTNHNIEGYGASLYGRSGGELVLDGLVVHKNSGTVGPGGMLWAVEDVLIQRSLFCENSAEQSTSSDGGAVATYLSGLTGGIHVRNNGFIRNQAGAYGGALSSLSDGEVNVEYNHFIGNQAAVGRGGAFAFRDADGVNFSANLLGWNVLGGGMYGDETYGYAATHNVVHEVAEGLFVGEIALDDLAETNQEVDPLLHTAPEDIGCAWPELWFDYHSAMFHGGPEDVMDLDGSRSDVGAFGGPGAGAEFWVDEDEDDWCVMWDCDDQDAMRSPGGLETPYDGIDQDCDDADLTDVDGDGFDGGDGPDCDDERADVHPESAEIWYDGVDQDCDGNDDDQDGDGHAKATDCDDTNPAIHPGASDEAGDGTDQDCDGVDGAEGCGGCGVTGGLRSIETPILCITMYIICAIRRRRAHYGNYLIG